MDAAARVARSARLALSRSPVAEICAVALEARDAAGTGPMEYVVVAVPIGRGDEIAPELERVARAHVET